MLYMTVRSVHREKLFFMLLSLLQVTVTVCVLRSILRSFNVDFTVQCLFLPRRDTNHGNGDGVEALIIETCQKEGLQKAGGV
ncbi:hypothetical protein QTP86_031135 [Hemibagrus guttatus]|nr:hypothetical protein QTP86_031135 [Hemibagrus guttatus]